MSDERSERVLLGSSRFQDRNAVRRERVVVRHDRILLLERMRDEQPVERITVMPGERSDTECRREPELRDFETGPP